MNSRGLLARRPDSTSCRLRSSFLRVEPVTFVTFANRRAKESMNETEKKIDPAQKESDQVVQRRANFDALKALGVDPYPHEFERTHGVRELVAAYGARTAEELTAERIETRTAGRILAIRSFGKANFVALSDGEHADSGLHPPGLGQRPRLLDFQAAGLRRFRRCRGLPVPHRTNELTIHVTKLEFLAKCFLPLPEKWHGLSDIEIRYRQRYLDLDRQSGLAPRVRGAQPRARRHQDVPQRARLSRSRDADDAADSPAARSRGRS